jgi:hypothetical protein
MTGRALPCPAHAELASEVRVIGVRLEGVEREVGRLASAVEGLVDADRASVVELLEEARQDTVIRERLARIEAELAHRKGITPRGGSTRLDSLRPGQGLTAKASEQIQAWAVGVIAAAVAAGLAGVTWAAVSAAGCARAMPGAQAAGSAGAVTP